MSRVLEKSFRKKSAISLVNWAALVQPKAYSAVHVFEKNTKDLRALVLSNPQHIARVKRKMTNGSLNIGFVNNHCSRKKRDCYITSVDSATRANSQARALTRAKRTYSRTRIYSVDSGEFKRHANGKTHDMMRHDSKSWDPASYLKPRPAVIKILSYLFRKFRIVGRIFEEIPRPVFRSGNLSSKIPEETLPAW